MPSDTPATGNGRMLRMPEILARLGVSRTTVWRKIRRGEFPALVQLGPNSVGLPETEFDRYQASLPRVTYAPDPQDEVAA